VLEALELVGRYARREHLAYYPAGETIPAHAGIDADWRALAYKQDGRGREREITDSLVELLIATVHRINAPAETRTRDQFVSEIARKVTGKENILFKIAAAASERRTASSRRWCNRRPAGWRCCWTWCASSSRRGRPTGRPGSGASRPPTPTTTGSGWSRSWRRWSSGRTTRCTGRCWRRWS